MHFCSRPESQKEYIDKDDVSIFCLWLLMPLSVAVQPSIHSHQSAQDWPVQLRIFWCFYLTLKRHNIQQTHYTSYFFLYWQITAGHENQKAHYSLININYMWVYVLIPCIRLIKFGHNLISFLGPFIFKLFSPTPTLLLLQEVFNSDSIPFLKYFL